MSRKRYLRRRIDLNLESWTSEDEWGEEGIPVGCWGNNEKQVDPGQQDHGLHSRAGRPRTVIGQRRTGLTEAKRNNRNKVVSLGRHDSHMASKVRDEVLKAKR